MRVKWANAADRRRRWLRHWIVPESAFRRLFADIFVGHVFLGHVPAQERNQVRSFEAILRSAAKHPRPSHARWRLWQKDAQAILEEQRPIATPESPADGTETDLLLRALGVYLILADRHSCSRKEFLSGGRDTPGVFRKMVQAAHIPLPSIEGSSLSQRVRRAGGHAEAIRRARALMVVLAERSADKKTSDLQPWCVLPPFSTLTS